MSEFTERIMRGGGWYASVADVGVDEILQRSRHGGGWYGGSVPDNFRASRRFWFLADVRSDVNGFRCASKQ
ncbi:MAG TPA: hypothetical protein VFB38_07170 [Chthonomonadaceae bacterium]|nr:hypothetical protein [Chthonomonadaceae bacterium]